MTQPGMPAPMARDVNKVIAKLQIRHAGVQGAAEKELAITQVAYEELQEQYAALQGTYVAVVDERDSLLEKLAEMTASEEAPDATEDADKPAPATPSSALVAAAVNGRTPGGVPHAD